jgi:hypothetical protein
MSIVPLNFAWGRAPALCNTCPQVVHFGVPSGFCAPQFGQNIFNHLIRRRPRAARTIASFQTVVGGLRSPGAANAIPSDL